MENDKLEDRLPQDMNGNLLHTGDKIIMELEIQGFQLNGLLDCFITKLDGSKVEYYVHRKFVRKVSRNFCLADKWIGVD